MVEQVACVAMPGGVATDKSTVGEYSVTGIPEVALEGCLVDGLVLRQMTSKDYEAVREMLPTVTRCSTTFGPSTVQEMLTFQSFFPFVIERRDPETHETELVGYAELHRLPHFGRGMDGRLEKVVVREEFRGKKIAQCACAQLLLIARDNLKCGRCDLTVEKPDAMTVYRRLGFEPVPTNVWRLML